MNTAKLSELSRLLLLAIDEAPKSPRLARCSMLAAALRAQIRQMMVDQAPAGEVNEDPQPEKAAQIPESVSDACFAIIVAAERDGSKKYFNLATGLHARIRELEGRLRDEIATNNARLATDDLADEDTQKFCRRLVRENETLRGQLHDEIDANTAFREAGGALPDEDMPTFCARLIRERNELSAVVGDIRNGVLIASSERDVAIAALQSARGTLEEIARPKVVANNVGSLMQEILGDTSKAHSAIDAIDAVLESMLPVAPHVAP